MPGKSPNHENERYQPQRLSSPQDRKKPVVQPTQREWRETDVNSRASVVGCANLHAAETIARDVARRPITVSTGRVLRHRRIAM